jgi:hypothetical protein
MFKALFKVQWKTTRAAILAATIFGFAIPLFSIRTLLTAYDNEFARITAASIVQTMQSAGVLYALLAGAAGLAVAFLAWSADHKGRHMYALALPVTRARYAMMRFGAGSAMLLLPSLGVLLGCLVALVVAHVPAGMHAYPLSLTMRFLLSSFVAFAIFFAIAGSSQRAAGMMLGGIGLYIVASVMIAAMGVEVDLIGQAADLLFKTPGLLSVFTGRWMLIDV